MSALRECGCETIPAGINPLFRTISRDKSHTHARVRRPSQSCQVQKEEMNMYPKTSRPLLYLVSAFVLGAVIGWSSPSNADIRRIVIDQTATINFTPITLGTATPGTPTSYTVYVGRSFGEVNPSDPNTVLTDISLAPKHGAGRVEY